MPVRVAREYAEGPHILRALEGQIDETFPSEVFSAQANSTLVLDLRGVTRINSYGVRLWSQALSKVAASGVQIYFVHVSPTVVSQLNMVVGFGSGASVLSFYGYLVCGSCTSETRYLFDSVADRDTIESPDTPKRQCMSCGLEAALDELPAFFFDFALNATPQTPNKALRDFLASKGSWIEDRYGESASFVVLKSKSKLRAKVVGNVDRSFDGAGVVENSRGVSVIGLWLGGLQYFEERSVGRWERFISKLTDNGEVKLFDCPVVFMRRALEDPKVLGQAKIAGVLYTMECGRCGHRELTRVPVKDNCLDLSEVKACSACKRKKLSPAGVEGFLDEISDWIEVNNDAEIEQRTRIEKTVAQAMPGHGMRRFIDAPTNAASAMPSTSAVDNRPTIEQAVVIPQETPNPHQAVAKGPLAQPQGGYRFRILAQKERTVLYDAYYAHLIGAGGFRKMQLVRALRSEYVSNAEVAEHFFAEARLLGQLAHECILRPSDVGRTPEAIFIAEEYIHGRTLSDVIFAHKERKRAMDTYWVLDLGCKLAEVLHYLHTRDVVHQDLAPGSIQLGFAGEVRLSGFGASVYAKSDGDKKTLYGTLEYLSPETIANRERVPASDVWSLGVLLLELLTGRSVFSGSTPEETASMIANQTPTIPNAVPRRVRKWLGSVLVSNPSQRPDTGQVVASLHELAARFAPRKGPIVRQARLADALSLLYDDQRNLETQFCQRVDVETIEEALVRGHPDEIGRFLRSLQSQRSAVSFHEGLAPPLDELSDI